VYSKGNTFIVICFWPPCFIFIANLAHYLLVVIVKMKKMLTESQGTHSYR